MGDMETRVSLLEQAMDWVKEELESARQQRDGLGTVVRQLRDSVNEMLQRDKDRARSDERRSRRIEQRIQVMTLVLLVLSLAVAVTGVMLGARL